MAASKDTLETLHEILTQALLDRIKGGEASASDLNVARQLLKDNGIESLRTPDNPLGQLAQALPEFEDDEIPFTN